MNLPWKQMAKLYKRRYEDSHKLFLKQSDVIEKLIEVQGVNKLPWKHTAKLYRNKYRVAKRKSDRQRAQITLLLEVAQRRHTYYLEMSTYILELERLIETGTERGNMASATISYTISDSSEAFEFDKDED